MCHINVSSYAVALLAEGVDRNFQIHKPSPSLNQSPSSRRAWIEIIFGAVVAKQGIVALLAEGVDRNGFVVYGKKPVVTSPSSRRAWIEILNGISLQW